MHLKNLSLIKTNDQWVFSPSYDLLNVQLHLPEDNEEMALIINGKKRNLTKEDFIDLGEKYGLNEKQVFNTFARFIKAEQKMKKAVQHPFLSSANRIQYIALLQERMQLPWNLFPPGHCGRAGTYQVCNCFQGITISYTQINYVSMF